MTLYETGCTHKWDFQSGSLLDQVGSMNLTNNGATLNTAPSQAKYYTFDGTDDYMTNASPVNLNSSAWTIEFAIKNPSVSGWKCALYNTEWLVYNNNATSYYFNCGSWNALSQLFTLGAVDHWAITWDGSKIRWYKNGVSDGGTSQTGNPPTGTSAFNLGFTDFLGFDCYFLRVWIGTCLTDAQVLGNCNAEKWRWLDAEYAGVTATATIAGNAALASNSIGGVTSVASIDASAPNPSTSAPGIAAAANLTVNVPTVAVSVAGTTGAASIAANAANASVSAKGEAAEASIAASTPNPSVSALGVTAVAIIQSNIGLVYPQVLAYDNAIPTYYPARGSDYILLDYLTFVYIYNGSAFDDIVSFSALDGGELYTESVLAGQERAFGPFDMTKYAPMLLIGHSEITDVLMAVVTTLPHYDYGEIELEGAVFDQEIGLTGGVFDQEVVLEGGAYP
jgi:hypothetical protein